MRPVPKTKIQEILEEIQPYLDLTSRLDTFTLQRYKRDVHKYLGADYWAGYVALAQIGLLEWDDNAILENFAKAIALQKTSLTYDLYANALQMTGRFAEALDVAVIASDLEPQNLTLLSNAIQYAHNAGKIAMAHELVEVYRQRSPTREHSDASVISDTAYVLATCGMSETLMQNCIRLAFDVLRKHQVSYSALRHLVDLDECYLMYYIDIDAPGEQVEALDAELGQRLFDEVAEFDPNRFWIGYEKFRARASVL
jgi:tetratricopeptide (TPR) repeat protein